MKTYIVKVQCPIVSSEENPGALIYNEDRSIFTTSPMTKEIARRCGGKGKFYAEAYIDTVGRLVIIGDVEDQPW